MSRASIPYATGPHRSPPRWRLALRRLLRYAILALLVALAVAAIIVESRHPWVWYGSRDAYQRHRMLTFAMAPEHVVYEEAPARVSKLLALPADPRTAYVGDPQRMTPYADSQGTGDYYRTSAQASSPYAEYLPRFYVRLTFHLGTRGLVFLHERIGAGGRRRMVLVTQMRTLVDYPAQRPNEANVRSGLEISTCSSPGNESFSYRRSYPKPRILIPVGFNQIARLYAGQADPKDDSRATIKYEIDDAPGTIEGRLNADDTVTLRVLDGPAVTTWKPVPRP